VNRSAEGSGHDRPLGIEAAVGGVIPGINDLAG
jgi:hypothetical protein